MTIKGWGTRGGGVAIVHGVVSKLYSGIECEKLHV